MSVRGLPLADVGLSLVTLATYTRDRYSNSSASDPEAGDLVTLGAGANHEVFLCADGTTARLGRVTRVESLSESTDEGRVVVEWFDLVRFVTVPCDDLSTATLGKAAIKDGDQDVRANCDAGGTTGSLIVWAKSAATGSGTLLCAVCVA